MNIDFSTLSAAKTYHLMTQTVIPRPIAWVLTRNPNLTYNLAPFSYFNAISSNPALLMFSVGKKLEGDSKDTYLNIKEHDEMVIHVPSEWHLESVNDSAKPLTRGKSEIDLLQLETIDFDFDDDFNFSLPRLKDCQIAFACKCYQITDIGNTPQALIIAEIKQMYVNDDAVSYDSKERISIDAKTINPLGRLGANRYTNIGEVLTLKAK